MNLPVAQGPPAEFKLVDVRFGLPAEVGDPVRRTQFQFGMAMALEAKRHAEGLGMIHLIHPVNPSVALDATDAAVDVDGVIEIDEVRQLVNLHPGNRPAGRIALSD